MEGKLKLQKQLYGQLVIGSPGSGKTTYCHKINEFYCQLGRKVSVVNLDPANEGMNYEPEIDIMHLITVEDVMDHYKLGPNGALMYCIEFLETNFDWLLERIKKSSSNYFIFDCPGQVELYQHHKSMRNIFTKLQTLGYKLCTVHLVDSHYCSEPHKYISALLLSLHTMLQMELPHVNVLSKADQIKEHQSKLLFNLDYYTEVLDLKFLVDALDSKAEFKKYKKLNEAIISLVEDYGLVTFQPLDVNETRSIARLYKLIDKANGYAFGASEEQNINSMFACAVGVESGNKKYSEDYEPYM
ncbi:hypothetical protein PVAND_010862 [Polypedilum vanderplanki]|uniref:GPN-loop GTPase 2 n=1 Tax=Polypedilum vanderplanki TaxID=319348 RepID=A0A9J6CGV7_POLVA|nr:hypothetical protein PVAND_010862 [Polypedilum vanderplanki]